MLYMTHVISLIYEHFYKSGAMMLWNAMMLLMTSFEIEAHRRIFQDATHLLRPPQHGQFLSRSTTLVEIKKMPWCKESGAAMNVHVVTVPHMFPGRRLYDEFQEFDLLQD